MTKTIRIGIYVLGLVLLLVLFLSNLLFGSVSIPLSEVLDILWHQSSDNRVFENIVLNTRLPQAIVATTAGIALGIAGLLMQTLFRNPLAGPSVLGISSGASLGVAFVVLVSGQVFGLSLSSIGIFGDFALLLASLLGSLAVLLIIMFVSKKIGGTLAVLIMGVMIGYLSNSIVGVMKYYSLEDDVHSFVMWGLGSFSRMSADRAMLFFTITIIPCAFSILLSKSLNLLSLGDRYARNLGLKIDRARTLTILTAGLLTAIVTAFCGPIVFIGMAVPHLAKLISRTSNHFTLIINAAILGAITALLCHLIARLPGLEAALPINSVTAFVGAPVVISVIWKRRKEQALQG